MIYNLFNMIYNIYNVYIIYMIYIYIYIYNVYDIFKNSIRQIFIFFFVNTKKYKINNSENYSFIIEIFQNSFLISDFFHFRRYIFSVFYNQ